MLKLLVHADDLGLTEAVNSGIVHAHRQGILTSASLMANGGAFAHAVALCRETPTLDVGVHLTLVGERPLLDPASVPSLVDADGRFHRHVTVFTKRYLLGKVSLHEVRAELEAQVAKLRDAGVTISHLDSHQHTHMLPGVLRVTEEIARKYAIPCVRFPSEAPQPYMLVRRGAVTRLPQLLALRSFCYLGRHCSVLHTDHFAGFFYGGSMNTAHLREVLEHLPRDGSCELMCHPGLADPASPYSFWGYRWADELEALTDPGIAAYLQQLGIQLISYRHLAAT